MNKTICCISAKADWYESSKLCKIIKEKLGVDIDTLGSDGTIQEYDIIIYVHSSKSSTDKVLCKWLKEACDLNKTFLPVIIGGSWISNKSVISNYVGPSLRTNFLQLYKEEDSFEFFNMVASFAGVQLNGDVLGAQVTLLADKDCNVYRDNQHIASLQVGVPYIVLLYEGNHKLIFKATEDERIQSEKIINISSIKDNYKINVTFRVETSQPEEQETTTDASDSESSNKLLYAILVITSLVLIGGIAYFAGYSSIPKTDNSEVFIDTLVTDLTDDSLDEETTIKEFLTKMYNSDQYNEYDFIEKHCSGHLLKKLQEDYDYDTDGVAYAVWDFRTCSQEVKPDCDEESRVINVESNGDGWYTYEFYDGGWRGKNRVKAFIRDGEVIMDALERLYDECSEAGLHSYEEAKAKIEALLDTNGKHTLEGYLTNNNSGYNTEKVKIVFTQSDGNVYNCIYYNEGVWDEHRNERIEMHGIRTAEGYHLENDNDYDALVIDVTLKETSLQGYVIRDGRKYSIDLNLE